MPTSRTSRLAALERRVAALEGKRASSSPAPKSALGLLDELAARTGRRFQRKADAGAVAYAGVAKLADREYRWAREHGVPELLDADWARASTLLECLGSPVRLTLLRALIHGPRDRQTLQAALGEATSGQLYHHLRDLQSARLLVQAVRGEYQIAPAAIIPVLAILSIALDLSATSEPDGDGA